MIYAAVFGLGMVVGGMLNEEGVSFGSLLGVLVLIATGLLYVGKTHL